MSNRSLTFSKIKQALTPSPVAPVTPTRTHSPVPLDGDPRRPARNFTNPRQLPGLEHMTASDGLTVLMPVVRQAPTQILPPIQAAQSVENLTATQILAPAPVAAPPSARHVDPAKRTTTFAEDNDLEPESRGRHVLDELKTEADDATAVLVAVQQRAHAVLDVYDPWRQVVVAARANDERMRALAAKWDAWETRYEREFESWAKQFKKDLDKTQADWARTSGQTDADRLALGMSGTNTVVAGMLEAARMRVELDAMLAADEQVSA